MTARALFEYKAVPSFRLLNGRFARAEKDLLESKRGKMRFQGARLVKLLREEAPSRTGAFAAKIRQRAFVQAEAVGFKIGMPQPLADFITKGTRSHPIVARRAKMLRFFWDQGPKGPGIYYFFSVNHPGTKANRFIGRAVRRWKPGARRALRQIALRYVQVLQGRTTGGQI